MELTCTLSEDDGDRHYYYQLTRYSLIGVSTLLIALTASTLRNYYLDPHSYNGITPLAMLLISITCVSLSILHLKTRLNVGSIAIVLLLLIGSIFCSFTWGVTLPFSMYLTILAPLVAGLLLGIRGLIATAIISTVIILVSGYLEITSHSMILTSWRNEPLSLSDVIEYIFAFSLIISLIVGINNKLRSLLSTKKRLMNELKDERDSLEVKVNERTNELKISHKEQLSQANRLALYGRVTQGAIHDIGNIVCLLNLALSDTHSQRSIKRSAIDPICSQLTSIVTNLTRGHITEEIFSVSSVLDEIHRLFSYEMTLKGIDYCITANDDEICLKGNKTLFTQCIHNLITNAIDALSTVINPKIKTIVTITHNNVVISIEDNGAGIQADIEPCLYDVGSTTKIGKHSGIGLYSTKHIVECYFNGNITHSSSCHGTTFNITLPFEYYESAPSSTKPLSSIH